MYKHINTLSCKEIDELGVSSLQTRINNDALTCEKGMALGIRMIIRWPVLVIGCTIMAFIVSPSIGGIFILVGLLIGGVIFVVSRVTIKRNRVVQKETDVISNITKENLSGARVIRAFNKENYERERFDKEINSLNKTQTSLGFSQSFLAPLTTIFTNLAILLIVYLGGFKVNIGNLTQGNITSLVSYMTQISLAVVVVGDLTLNLSKASVSAKRILEIFNTKTSIVSGNVIPTEQTKVVEFKDVTFGYNSKSSVLKNISFSVDQKEVIGIIGGTGSGKTTLVDLIMRFYDVNEGEVLVNGENVKNIDLNYLHNYISLVSQKATLFKGTIRENLNFRNREASDEELYRALEIAQAKDVVFSKKDGLDSLVSEEGKNFSGGQRQRLSIARALVNDPKVIILDDSSSALDYKTDLNLRKALKDLDATVFIISQRAASLKHADKILVLDEGKLIATGTHEELVDKCELYKEICDSQDERGN